MAAPSSSLRHSESQDVNVPTSIKAGERQYQSEMMFIGERCHLSVCHREDFLPFRCPDCHHQFCSDHYKTEEHKCAHASATFLVPLCPLCHEPPKNWRRNEDPNIAMNLHLSPHPRTRQIECRAVDEQGVVRDDAKGKQRREKKENECNERRCKKLMIVRIDCPSCRLQFCPSHRAPIQHACLSTQAKAASPRTTKSGLRSIASLVTSTNGNTSTFDTSSTNTPASSTSEIKEKPSSARVLDNKSNPLQAIGAVHKGLKMDKRARMEHESALKALQARHAKGLLTPAEEVRLAQEMALLQEKRNTGRDCIVI